MSLNQAKEKSGSSLRSLAGTSTGFQTVKPPKKLKPSKEINVEPAALGKENDSKNNGGSGDPKISKAKKTVIKRRDHNYSTSSTQVPVTSSIPHLRKVLPGKVVSHKKTQSPKPTQER